MQLGEFFKEKGEEEEPGLKMRCRRYVNSAAPGWVSSVRRWIAKPCEAAVGPAAWCADQRHTPALPVCVFFPKRKSWTTLLCLCFPIF